MKRTNNEEIKVLTQEEKDRCLDFAKRMVFKGYDNLTQKRREKLWSDVEWFLTDALEEGHWGWETGSPEETFAMCDWIRERFEKDAYPSSRWEHKVCDLGIEPKYFSMLSATCRAAMDIVNDFAGGVWGWTVSDIRRMYDGEIPNWFPLDGWYYLGDGPAPRLTDECSVAL
jgi:hypothetical protein